MKKVLLLVLVAALAGCDATSPLADSTGDPVAHRGEPRGAPPFRVLSRNVFVGADVDLVLGATSPDQIPALVAQIYPMLFDNDFHDRAVALAREIRRTRPDLVGLQEISTVRIQSPGDAVVGGTVPAETVVFDYLGILMRTLEDMRLPYRVAAVIQNADVEVPMLTGLSPLTFDDVRLTDFDVILARRGVETSQVATGNFQARLSIPIGGVAIDIPRGYAAVTAHKAGSRIRFVNTHLEPLSVPALLPLQRAQAAELMATVASATDPVVIVGDLNTEAPAGVTYGDFLGAGFVDAWAVGPRADEPGLTCCHALTLDNEMVDFDQRIDLVMLKGSLEQLIDVSQTRVIGWRPRERTPAGLWPSDHAGLFAQFRFSQPAH